MMMQPQQPVGMGMAAQPLLQPPPCMAPPVAYHPAPVVMAAPPASGPVQNNNTSQSVVINQPGGDDGKKKRLLVDPEGVRVWSTGLFGCLDDIASCGCALLCCPVLLCRVANRMKECAFISCAAPGGFTAMRVKLRTMGGIKGSICQDCLVTHCFPLCAACQMSRELDSMGL